MTDARDRSVSQDTEFSVKDELADPLDPWARIVALIFGTAASSFGCYAVLASDNQAGTAFVLLTGVVMLLLGLQGTPLRRLGSGEHSLVLATLRRRQIAGEVIAEAVREQPPAVAAAVAEAVRAVEPFATRVNSSGHSYEWAVKEAIERQGIQILNLVPLGHADEGFDLVAQLPSGMVKVLIKHRLRPLSTYDVMAANQRVSHVSPGGYLLITNSPVSAAVRNYNNESSSDPDLFEVVTWSSPDDDEALSRALTRNAR